MKSSLSLWLNKDIVPCTLISFLYMSSHFLNSWQSNSEVMPGKFLSYNFKWQFYPELFKRNDIQLHLYDISYHTMYNNVHPYLSCTYCTYWIQINVEINVQETNRKLTSNKTLSIRKVHRKPVYVSLYLLKVAAP